MDKEYLKRDDVQKTEHTWCKLSEDKLEYLDWVFVEKQAQEFDTIGDAGVRDNIMMICKLLVLVRQQTLEKSIDLLARFKQGSNDSAAVVFYDPLAKTSVKPATFVFFHVGDQIKLVNKLIDSIKKTNPQSRIIMCTDAATPLVQGVERIERLVEREYLMHHRWLAYRELGLNEPAVYLDTDMIVRGTIDVELLLSDKDYVFCSRSFQKNAGFNGQQRGLDFSEYHNRPINDVYPVLGCFVITRDSSKWTALVAAYEKLADKFKRWYGDQEVLRDFRGAVNYVEESRYACLPEHADQHTPYILHYKGNRKNEAA